MMCKWTLLIQTLYLLNVTVKLQANCHVGFNFVERTCVDDDECDVGDYEYDEDHIEPCGENATCVNTFGSFYCQCVKGLISTEGTETFSAGTSATCKDINECMEVENICGPNATCFNTIPNYSCFCNEGFISSTGVEAFRHGDNVTCTDIDECQEKMDRCGQHASCVNTQGSYYCVCNAGFQLKSGALHFSENLNSCEDVCLIDETLCGNGTCHQGPHGHYCKCHLGNTNYGNWKARCTPLECNHFKNVNNLREDYVLAHDLIKDLLRKCQKLTENKDPVDMDGDEELERLLAMIDEVLSSGVFKHNKQISTFLDLVEKGLKIIGPFVTPPGANRSSNYSELDFQIHKGPVLPQGPTSLSSRHSHVDMHLETAAGNPSHYPGFTTLSLLSYLNLERSANAYFIGVKQQTGQSFKLNSKVVTVTISNINTSHLKEPVNITLYHLVQSNQTSHTCVFWNASMEGGAWSTRGCKAVESNQKFTVCSCTHLSSFAVLMAVYDMEDVFELQLITFIGLTLSLICLFFCILTFSFIRSIQNPRTTIHLHLCISLFIAILLFLTCISATKNQFGCGVIAALLHYFFLASFCWMCLEGIQLFRMVVLVFNTSFKPLYMFAGGYGAPAIIVGISALVNAKGYGTPKYCWLNLDIIWSFFGPACVIIIVNIFFFLITVWKLAQKLSSLNPDLNNLQKIKTFTITAVAQLCVLGAMWIFGCFQFEGSSVVVSYLFTIFGSLQGVMLFSMHCLLSKQVRDEYANIFCRCCAPRKKPYSEFSHSSKAHTSKSSHDTGESHI